MKPNTTRWLSALMVCANLLYAAWPAAAQEKFPTRPIEKAFAQAVKSDKFCQSMEAKGVTIEGGGAGEFRKLIDSEYKAMGDVVTALGMGKK